MILSAYVVWDSGKFLLAIVTPRNLFLEQLAEARHVSPYPSHRDLFIASYVLTTL